MLLFAFIVVFNCYKQLVKTTVMTVILCLKRHFIFNLFKLKLELLILHYLNLHHKIVFTRVESEFSFLAQFSDSAG